MEEGAENSAPIFLYHTQRVTKMAHDISDLLAAVAEEFDVITMEEWADRTYRMLVLQGILFTRSLDHDKIAQWMVEDQGEFLHHEAMLDIVQAYIPILQAEGHVDGNGKLSAQAALDIHEHMTQRYGGGMA